MFYNRFQVYSKYRGSRTSYQGAGFGAAFGQALAAENITLIPRLKGLLTYNENSLFKYF